VTDESNIVNARKYNFEQNENLLATQDPLLLPDGGGNFQFFDNASTDPPLEDFWRFGMEEWFRDDLFALWPES
jgi:hypothetical protein